MSYQVMARERRPEVFDEVVAQDHIVKTLQNAIRTDRIAQAYLFSGPRGTGKTTTARLLAKALNCEEGPTPTPCGKCASCVAIKDGRSLDVREIDGASTNSFDDVRQLREEVASVEKRAAESMVHVSQGFRRDDLETAVRTLEAVADRLYDEVLCLPSSVGLEDAAQRRVVAAIRDAAGA